MDTELLSERMKRVAKALEEMKKAGVDREIMEIYLSHKTKLKISDVKKLLDNQERFFKKLVAEAVTEKL